MANIRLFLKKGLLQLKYGEIRNKTATLALQGRTVTELYQRQKTKI